MRYTKPHVLTTMDANRAIQTQSDPASGKNISMVDNPHPPTQSTTGAYEADE
jgi:hypothetical protein